MFSDIFYDQQISWCLNIEWFDKILIDINSIYFLSES